MPRGHALGLHLLAGAIVGDAPYFDRFFVGDLNLLLPRRALGINFSTLSSRACSVTGIARHRYDDFAGRLLVEYAIRLWRRHGLSTAATCSRRSASSRRERRRLRPPERVGVDNLPLDLTGDLGLRLDT